MFYHCFILTIEQSSNHFFFFLLTVDPWGLLAVQKLWKAAHNLCLLDFDLFGPSSIYLWDCFSKAVYSEKKKKAFDLKLRML